MNSSVTLKRSCVCIWLLLMRVDNSNLLFSISFMIVTALPRSRVIFWPCLAFLKQASATSAQSSLHSIVTTLPSLGRPSAMARADIPVKVPISRTFFAPDTWTWSFKNWLSRVPTMHGENSSWAPVSVAMVWMSGDTSEVLDIAYSSIPSWNMVTLKK